jgi:hypothetical protein
MKMEDREVIKLKYEWSDYKDFRCDLCCYAVESVVRGVDELGRHIKVCRYCVADHRRHLHDIDVKLEEQAVELEKDAADFVEEAARLRNLKGCIKASALLAAFDEGEAIEADLARQARQEEEAIEGDLARVEEELLPPELRQAQDAEPPEAEAA